MENPIAVKLLSGEPVGVHRVSINPAQAGVLTTGAARVGPAIVVTRNASLLAGQGVGLIDGDKLLAVLDGDWAEAILIVLPAESPVARPTGGDHAFLASVAANAPHLSMLATEVVQALRDGGVEGELFQDGSGRWVNRPVNMLTLKAQPRAGTIAFTLYGNPEAFEAGDFLRRDQNSYSRGWITSRADIGLFVSLAKRSQTKRRA